MTLRDALRLALSALRGGIVRTLLTILGLSVGVGAVLTVLTLGNAGQRRVEEEIVKLGVNKVWVRPKDDRYTLLATDASAMRETTAAPACAGTYTVSNVRHGETVVMAQIAAFDEGMAEVHTPRVLTGRLFLPDDYDCGSAVCMIDESLSEHLHGAGPGDYVSVSGRRLRIVGVMKGMTIQTMAGGGMLLMPLQTLMSMQAGHVAEITLCVQPGQEASRVAELALKALEGREGFRADTLEKEIAAAREVVRIFVMVLACVSLVCMLSGGIGVMNVLLVAVRERRAEIGLIKAVGGSSGQVALLFLLEGMVYALCGGLLGVLLGMGMIAAFSWWIGLEARLHVMTLLPVLLGATVLGLCAGVIPALRAAALQPIDALRCE